MIGIIIVVDLKLNWAITKKMIMVLHIIHTDILQVAKGRGKIQAISKMSVCIIC